MALHRGTRIVSFNLNTRRAHSLQAQRPIDITLGREDVPSGGLCLATCDERLDFYREGTHHEDLILTFEYDDEHIISGTTEPNSEVVVSQGTLVDVRFDKEEIQERFGFMLNGDPSERRDLERGKSLGDLWGKNYPVVIMRAMNAKVSHFGPMDYCYAIRNPMKKHDAQAVHDHYHDEEPLTSISQKSLRKTVDHAVTMAVTEEEAQHVMVAVVPAKDVYQATNTGECFYDGKMKAGNILLTVDENGIVEMKQHEPTSTPTP